MTKPGREIIRRAITLDAGEQIFNEFITSVLGHMAGTDEDEEMISATAKIAALHRRR